MMTLRWLLGITTLVIFVSACTGLASEPAIVRTVPPRPTIDTTNPEDLGATVFAARCASCHGETGHGDGAVAMDAGLDVPDFTLEVTSINQSLTEWTNTIRFGRLENMMPPWENSLSDEEIEAVAAYTFTMWQEFPQTTESVEATAVLVVEEAIGDITAGVIQGTSGADLPDIVSVALHVLDEEGNEASFDMQVLENDLTFTYEDVLIRHDYTYFISAIYDGVVFYSDIVFGKPETPDLDLPVQIYDVTHDESVIEVDLFLIRLIPDDNELIVQQLMNFRNTSDRVYRGNNQLDGFTYDSVRIPLPNDSELLNSVELIPRFLELEGEGQQTLLDTQPVLPNSEHLVEVVYALPLPNLAEGTTISLPVRYNLSQSVEIMVQPSQFTVVSEAFTSTGVEHFSVGVYESYVSEPMPANSLIEFEIRPPAIDAATAANQSGRNNLVAILALGGIGLLMLSGVVLFLGSND